MKYQAMCKMHDDFEPPVRDDYATAMDDLTEHQADAHAMDVVLVDPAAVR
jgi:hypothetical protein